MLCEGWVGRLHWQWWNEEAVEEVALSKGPGVEEEVGEEVVVVLVREGAVEGRKCENPWQDALEGGYRIL